MSRFERMYLTVIIIGVIVQLASLVIQLAQSFNPSKNELTEKHMIQVEGEFQKTRELVR